MQAPAGELLLLRVGETFVSFFLTGQDPEKAFRAGNGGSEANARVAGP
jgi:hypothetical protein